MRPIAEVAADIGLGPDDYEPYGRDKAKIPFESFPQTAEKGS